MSMVNDYFIGEGNKIGSLPAEFGSNLEINQKQIIADGDVAKGQVVYVSADCKVKATTAASKAVLGVAMFAAKSGEPVSVETEGLFKLTASAAIAAGSQVESAADGKVATVGSTPVKVIGIALTAAAAAGDPVYIKFSI